MVGLRVNTGSYMLRGLYMEVWKVKIAEAFCCFGETYEKEFFPLYTYYYK